VRSHRSSVTRRALVGALLAVALGSAIWFGYLRDPREVRVCEAYVKTGLLSPSSYRRTSYQVIDEPASSQLYGSLMGWRYVTLNYLAKNAYGVEIARIEACQFQWIGEPAATGSREPSSVAENERLATEEFKQQNPGQEPPGCCVQITALKGDPLSKK
jgi:hypothetical protein